MKSSMTAAGYLSKVQKAFLNLHDSLGPQDRPDWMSQFRRQTSSLNLDQSVSHWPGMTSRDEVSQTFNPESPTAQEWAQEKLALSQAALPDPEEPFAAFDLL